MRKVVLYIMLSIVLFSSCHSSKKIVSSNDYKQYEAISLYDSIIKHYGDFSTVSFKFSIDSKELLKSLPIQVKGTVRIKKDSIIWISIAPTMNIEMVRCVLTQDSVKFYSKIQKVYYDGSIDSLNRNGNSIDFKTIQSIFLNELFFVDQHITDTIGMLKNFEVNIKNNISVMKTYSKKEFKKNDTLSLQQVWTIDNDNFRISDVELTNVNVEEKDELNLRVHYGNFETIQDINFPSLVSVKAKKNSNKVTIDMEYSKIKFNEDLSFPFSQNADYRKLDLKN